jgi:hypothetical protein
MLMQIYMILVQPDDSAGIDLSYKARDAAPQGEPAQPVATAEDPLFLSTRPIASIGALVAYFCLIS